MVRVGFCAFIFSLAVQAGCTSVDRRAYSTDTSDSRPSQASQALAEAYTGHHFTFVKEQVDRSAWSPTQFYFKECSLSNLHNHYSKTAYECSSP